MEEIAIPQGFRVTPEQFDQLAEVEQIARMELTKDIKTYRTKCRSI